MLYRPVRRVLKGGLHCKKIPIELLPGLPVESTLLEKKVYISS